MHHSSPRGGLTLAPPDPWAVEQAGLNAWPALKESLLDGWVLRFADGHTKRANSVNGLCRAQGGGAIEARIRLAEHRYAQAGQPTLFRVTPFLLPTDMDRRLEERGYRRVDPCLVMTRALAGASAADGQVTVSGGCDGRWLNACARLTGLGLAEAATLAGILGRIPGETAFAVATDGTQPLACGLAVREEGLVGLFTMAVADEARRQGWGQRIARSLMAWGHQRGAGHAYLQVVEANLPATGLYRRLGFQPLYRYHYRVKD